MGIRSIGTVGDDIPADPQVRAIAGLDGVRDVVLLPDAHLKEKYVTAGYACAVPSSAVIVADRFYPQLRSRGLGCGMALWRLYADRADDDALLAFVRRATSSRPSFRSRVDEVLAARFPRLPDLGRGRYALARRGWLDTLNGGAPRYLAAHGLPATGWTQHVVRPARAERLSLGLRASRDFRGGDRRSGLWLAGNHFLEVLAARGGGLYVLAHVCGGGLKWTLDPATVARRIRRQTFLPVSDPADVDAIDDAVALLANLGSLRRAILHRRLLDSAAEAGWDLRLAAESSHNTWERRDGLRICRHNAVALPTAGVTVVSGGCDHPSYLVAAGPRAADSHHTAPHGLGTLGGGNAGRGRVLRLTGRRVAAHPLRSGEPGAAAMRGLEALGVLRVVDELVPRVSAGAAWRG